MAIREIKEGDRVVHKKLDTEDGIAKTGIVLDVPDDNLVIAQFEGRVPEGFVKSELVSLGPAKYSNGPVLLYPRHLLAIFKQPAALAAFFISVLVGVAINILSQIEKWDISVTLVVSAISILISFFLFSSLLSLINKKQIEEILDKEE